MSARVKNLLIGAVCFVAGALALATISTMNAQPPAGESKTPKWLHAMNLKARKHTEGNFDDKTTKFGIECFRDENNGNLIYISETGSIAVVPGK